MLTIKKSKVCSGYYLANIPFVPFSILEGLFGDGWVDIDNKVEYEWCLALYKDDEKLCDFRIYDYYGDHWHIGGDETTSKYIPEILEALKALGLDI